MITRVRASVPSHVTKNADISEVFTCLPLTIRTCLGSSENSKQEPNDCECELELMGTKPVTAYDNVLFQHLLRD